MGTRSDGHVAATRKEERRAQRIGQLCARKKVLTQLETIMVVIKTAMILMDLESVNKRNNEQTTGTNLRIISTFFLPIDYLSIR